MTAFFVTGTDTDAGKTHASCALLFAARRRQLSCAGYKPIESGCPVDGSPGHDAMALGSAAGTEPITTYTFAPPIAPHIAAQRAGKSVVLEPILTRAAELQDNTDFFLVEGAGGFLVPISGNASMATLAQELQLPIIIVAPNRLGAINHSLLTIEAARARGLSIAAVVLSAVANGAGDGLENRQSIAQVGEVPAYELPHCNTDLDMAMAAEPILNALLDSD